MSSIKLENKKSQLHVSMLGTISACGIQFQRRYGARFGIWPEEEIIPPGIALVIGISTHKAIQCNLDNKIRDGELLPREEVKQIARDAFSGIWQGGMTFSEEEAQNMSATQSAAIDMTIRLSDLHYTQLAPKLNPEAVEEPFVIELENYPFDLAGQIDIRESYKSKNNDIYSLIRDTKTSGKTPSADTIRSIQMAMYSLGHKVLHKKLPDRVFLDFLVKTKTPKLVILDAEPEEKWIAPLYHRIERFAEIIEAVKSGKQALTPANPDDWRCQERWCGYAQTCKYWSGR